MLPSPPIYIKKIIQVTVLSVVETRTKSVCISGIGVSETDSPMQILFSKSSFFPISLPFYFPANQPTKLSPISAVLLTLRKITTVLLIGILISMNIQGQFNSL